MEIQDAPNSMAEAIRRAYRHGQEDEALEPIVKCDRSGRPRGRLESGDSVIFYDIRGEREIQLTQCLTAAHFDHFPWKPDLHLEFVTMIEYAPWLRAKAAFLPEGKIKNTLTEVLTKSGLRVVKISESEKAVHVGHFFNGKNDEVFGGEERVVIPSPQCRSYADRPEMSVREVGREILKKLADASVDVIIANLANVDVVGHIEDRAAILKAVEAVDRELGRIEEEARKQNVTLIVTSDHGTVEEWLYPDGAVNTGHTRNPVPFMIGDFGAGSEDLVRLRSGGELADVAPTVLELMGIAPLPEMSGKSLLLIPPSEKRRRLLLLILDGWGFREEKYGNLIAEARTPNFSRIWEAQPHSVLESFGEAVGMPSHTVGNSEAGHLHLGAGRRILLDRVKIDKAIESGTFFHNEVFLGAMERANKQGRALHLLGIVSHYSSHGTIRHLFALLKMAAELGLTEVYIHSLIGRRGEKPESGAVYVEKVEEMCRSLSLGEVVTVVGRFWALDREENWDRIERAYRALVFGEGTKVLSV